MPRVVSKEKNRERHGRTCERRKAEYHCGCEQAEDQFHVGIIDLVTKPGVPCPGLDALLFEKELGKIIQALFPMLEVVCVFIHMPGVRNILLLQVSVHALADANESILIAT
ncbi:MAG: hypothetical protein JWM04_762 [Verrucomicrobiales bacterium]|nr:hypothetical protein [Verrucomicrobiales bacterium]